MATRNRTPSTTGAGSDARDPSAPAAAPVPCISKAKYFAIGVLAAAVFAGIIWLAVSSDLLHVQIGNEPSARSVGTTQPGEFMYLDSDRVAAYLAQMEGGTSFSEHLTEKLTTEASVKAGVGEAVSVGGTAQNERFVERTVTPTAASSFFRLLNELDENSGEDSRTYLTFLSRKLGHLAALQKKQGLSTGDFVKIKKAQLVPPRYINPYLVVRQAGTLPALFPTERTDPSSRQEANTQRRNAERFARQVGPNPRMVFVFRPQSEEPSTPATARYLLPMQYQELTDERSLLEGSGGGFTVVGKVVRIFRGPNGEGGSGYIDSATRQTWGEPLKQAPRPLLKRGSLSCQNLPPRRTIRGCLAEKLTAQTELVPGESGAVIIPVAIYK
jgi:hypothetical protein